MPFLCKYESDVVEKFCVEEEEGEQNMQTNNNYQAITINRVLIFIRRDVVGEGHEVEGAHHDVYFVIHFEPVVDFAVFWFHTSNINKHP